MKKFSSFTRFEKSFLVHRKLYLVILILIIFNSVKSFGQVAAVNPPTGGFAIDGGLKANTPTSPAPFAANQGDWFPGAAGSGSGGSVFTAAVVANNTATSGKAVDLQATNSDNVFTQGSKFNDYISSLHWGTSSAPDKNDINNALYHISRDGNNDQWVFMAGDRLSTNGTSYIDFEFLQGTITKNANGTFTGSGNAGTSGRTENDMIVSMEYTNGGTKPLVYVYQWKLSGGTWSYQLVQNLNVADAFAETNRSGAEADVPFTVFGSNTYQQFAFVEAAINISNLLELSGQACQGLNIQTLWIKTKASAVSTAALKDFMEPIPVGLSFGSASVNALGPLCVSDNTQYTLGAEPSGGTFAVDGVPATTFRASDYAVGTHAIAYTFSGCSANAIVVVDAAATVDAGANQTICAGSTVTLAGSVGGGATSGTWSGGSGSFNPGNTTLGAVYTPGAADVTAGTVVLTLTTNNPDGPCAAVADNVTITINPNPTVTVNSTAICASNVSATMTASPSGGTAPYSYVWSVPGGDNPGNVASFSASVAGNYSVVVTDNKNCSSVTPGSGTLTINDNPGMPAVTYTAPLCDQTTFSITVTNVISGATYIVKNRNGATISGLSPASGYVAPDNSNIVFSNIPAGNGYQVTVQVGSCLSTANTCGTAGTIEACGAGTTANLTNTNTEAVARVLGSATLEEPTVTVKAMPNPFSNKVRFMITNPEAGKGTLDIYNMAGQKVKTVYEGHIPAGVSYFDLTLATKQVANHVYILRIGDKKMTGKILQINQ